MAANPVSEEKTLIDGAVSCLQENLPATWKAEATSQTMGSPDPTRPPRVVDALINITGPQGAASTLLVEAKSSFAPRDVERFLSGLARQLRILNQSYPILVVAPWLSDRAREVLAAEDINYLDLTGNARIALNYPALFISTRGESRNPAPTPRGIARVKGPKAGRLIRLLVDVAPPYGVSQIASATGLAPGYVSRLLESLDEDALIERTRRGQVQSVDISAILRRWAQTYDVFKSNESSSFVAPQGPGNILERLASTATSAQVAVAGSFAAVRIAPVAAPALLVLYCTDSKRFASDFGLLPADRGSNVALLRPFDPVVWERTTTASGVTYTSVSQTAIDCLTGNGRMRSEGEALMAWMDENETQWRLSSLEMLPDWKST